TASGRRTRHIQDCRDHHRTRRPPIGSFRVGVTPRPYRFEKASSTKNVNHDSLRSADRTVTLSCAPALYTERSFVQPWSVSRLLPKVSHGRFPARVPVRFPLAPRRRIELGLPPSQIVRERQLPLLGPCRH